MSSILAITYDDAIPVTPSDTANDPAGPFAGFHTGAGGTIKVRTIKGTDRTITNLPAGVIYPLAILRVWNTPSPPVGVLGTIAMPFKGAPNPS